MLLSKVLELVGKSYSIGKVAIWTTNPDVVKLFLDKTICPKLKTLYVINEYGPQPEEDPTSDSRVVDINPKDRIEYCHPELGSVDLCFIDCAYVQPDGFTGWQRKKIVKDWVAGKSKFVMITDVLDGWFKGILDSFKTSKVVGTGKEALGIGSNRVNLNALTLE